MEFEYGFLIIGYMLACLHVDHCTTKPCAIGQNYLMHSNINAVLFISDYPLCCLSTYVSALCSWIIANTASLVAASLDCSPYILSIDNHAYSMNTWVNNLID